MTWIQKTNLTRNLFIEPKYDQQSSQRMENATMRKDTSAALKQVILLKCMCFTVCGALNERASQIFAGLGD